MSRGAAVLLSLLQSLNVSLTYCDRDTWCARFLDVRAERSEVVAVFVPVIVGCLTTNAGSAGHGLGLLAEHAYHRRWVHHLTRVALRDRITSIDLDHITEYPFHQTYPKSSTTLPAAYGNFISITLQIHSVPSGGACFIT